MLPRQKMMASKNAMASHMRRSHTGCTPARRRL